jgi:hypothetical protein
LLVGEGAVEQVKALVKERDLEATSLPGTRAMQNDLYSAMDSLSPELL